MNRRNQSRPRVAAAVVCLLAVVFVYAPFAAAAWSSHSMACCTAGYCNIPKHHHAKGPANSAAAEDCGHGAGALMNCSMSCCQDPDKLTVLNFAFVMPPAAAAFSTMTITHAGRYVKALEIPRAIEPQSPPPRVRPRSTSSLL